MAVPGDGEDGGASQVLLLLRAEKDMAAALLRARGDSPIDLRAYLHEGNLVAAKIVRPPSSPPPPPPSLTPQVMDASANAMAKKNLSAQNAAAEKATVKSETPSIGEKRKQAEDDAYDWSSGCSGQSAPACGGGSAALGDHPVPRGFFPKNPPPTGSEDGKAWCACAAPDGAAAAEGEWKVERQLLQGIVTPSRESELAAANPADVIASTYMSLLQTANHVAFSLRYALELDDKLRARERDAGAEADALREELWSVKAELAETKAAAADGRSDRARALAENAREAYERGREDMRRAVLRRHPHLDLARIVAPPCDDAGAGAGSA